MENAQKKEKLDVRARPYKEGRPRWVGFIQDVSYLVGKAMPPHGMPSRRRQKVQEQLRVLRELEKVVSYQS